jgi:PAS domain S-box-containing protein
MKLNQIIILSFIIVAVLGSIGGSYYFYLQSNAILEQEIKNHLESVAQSTENFINSVLEGQVEKVKIAATHSELSIEELKEITDLESSFDEVFVLDSNGIVTVSSDESQIGKDKSDDSFFINTRDESYIKPAYLSESTNEGSIAVATPFNEGVLVARVQLESFSLLVSDRTGLGETGESLLAYKGEDGKAVFFTERRFRDVDVDVDVERVLPIDQALLKKEDIFFGLNDYRNIEVISVTRYLDEINVGLVTKIDESEVLGLQRKELLKTSLIIIIVITIIFGLVGMMVARVISKSIKSLTEDVDSVSKGKFDLQLKRSNISEIQSLTDSLNRILTSLKLAILRTGMKKTAVGLGKSFEAKKESEETYKKLYETSSDAMIIIGEGRFIDCNSATLKMFNIKSVREFIKLSPWDVSPEKQPDGIPSSEKAKKMMSIAMKKGSHRFSWTHKRFNGSNFKAEVTLTKLNLKDKAVLQATVRDLTKKLRENKSIKKREQKSIFTKIKEKFSKNIDPKLVEEALKEKEERETGEKWAKEINKKKQTVKKKPLKLIKGKQSKKKNFR